MSTEITENTAPFSADKRDLFSLTPSEKKSLDQIFKIFSSNGGIYAVAGNRGTGKSSLKNMAIFKINKNDYKKIILNVSYYGSSQNFYRDLLFQLINGLTANTEKIEEQIEQKFNEMQCAEIDSPLMGEPNEAITAKQGNEIIDQIVGKFQSEQKCVSKYSQKIEDHVKCLKQEILAFAKKGTLSRKYDPQKKLSSRITKQIEKTRELTEKILELSSDLNEIFEYIKTAENQLHEYDANVTDIKKYIRDTTVQAKAGGVAGLKIPIPYNWVNLDIKTETSVGQNRNNHISKEIKFENSEEIKINQILNLLSNISPKYRITLTIDELDKLDNPSLLDFINMNKMLLLDTGINTLLIMDTYSSLYLLEESDYLNRDKIVLIPSLTFQEYIEKKRLKGFSLENNIYKEFEGYFNSKMAIRDISSSNDKYQNSTFAKGFLLFKFADSYFIHRFDPIYREVFLRFVWEILDTLNFTDTLLPDQIKIITDKFINKNNITSQRVIFNLEKVLKNIDNGFNYFPYTLQDILRKKDYSRLQKNLITNYFRVLFYLQTITLIPEKVLKVSKNSLNPHAINPTVYWEIEFNKLLHRSNLKANDIYDLLVKMNNIRDLPPSASAEIRPTESRQIYQADGVRTANKIIATNNILGAVFFHPLHDDGLHLNNGVIISYNSFDEYIYFPILGYPGLQSHNPHYFNEFKANLKNDGVAFLEIPNTKEIHKSDVENFINENIRDWVEELRKNFS